MQDSRREPAPLISGHGILGEIVALGSGLGQSFIGGTIDRSGDTAPVFSIEAAACLIGAALGLAIRK